MCALSMCACLLCMSPLRPFVCSFFAQSLFLYSNLSLVIFINMSCPLVNLLSDCQLRKGRFLLSNK